MWSLSAWRRRRLLAKHPIADDTWQRVRQHLSFLDGISAAEDQWLREACVLFLADKHLTALPGVELHQEQRLLLAAQAQLPLLNLGDLNWYQGFHEIVLYPDDFLSPNAIAMPAASSMSGTASTAAKPGNRARSSSPGPA
jgi:Mlc titration factor MtfA (ptsG expression regulator)